MFGLFSRCGYCPECTSTAKLQHPMRAMRFPEPWTQLGNFPAPLTLGPEPLLEPNPKRRSRRNSRCVSTDSSLQKLLFFWKPLLPCPCPCTCPLPLPWRQACGPAAKCILVPPERDRAAAGLSCALPGSPCPSLTSLPPAGPRKGAAGRSYLRKRGGRHGVRFRLSWHRQRRVMRRRPLLRSTKTALFATWCCCRHYSDPGSRTASVVDWWGDRVGRPARENPGD